MELTFNELLDYFQVSASMIKTNFPKFAQRQLAQGYLINRRGKGDCTIYTVTKVEPQIVDKLKFSQRTPDIQELPGESWVPCYFSKTYEVSDCGRVRHKLTKRISKGYVNSQGYIIISLDNENYRMHRVVLQSFNPRKDYDNLTVDHLDGNRSNNKLENLEWTTGDENTLRMLNVRADLNKELTRLIQKYGYDEVLQKLKEM